MPATVTVQIPTPLRGQVDGQAKVELQGTTIREVLTTLADRYPKLRGRLLDERNEINRFVNVFLNEEDIRFLANLDTPVKQGDGIMIVPAIAGGSCGLRDDTGPPRSARQGTPQSPSTTRDCVVTDRLAGRRPRSIRPTRPSRGSIEHSWLDTRDGSW